jgi:hypothetical protein
MVDTPDESMYTNCPECRRLWQECEDAIKSHLAILGHVESALLEQNVNVLATLEPILAAASDRRTKARRELKDHEVKHTTDR